MSEYDWWTNVQQFFTNLGTKHTTASLPVQEYRFNEMYPYTIEQTIKVTHHTKPKRRDPSRNWRNK